MARGRWTVPAFLAIGAILWALAGCGTIATPTGEATIGSANTPGTATRSQSPITVRQTASPPTSPPPDFAFILMSDHCGDRDTLDTFTRQFSRYVPPGNNRSGLISIDFALSATELTTIYRQMVAINLFSYPETVSPTSRVRVAPFSTYELTVHRDSHIARVRYTTGNVTPTAAETELDGLISLIFRIARAHSEIEQLPSGFGCT